MARVKQTARKGPAKKKSGADKRRSPRIAAHRRFRAGGGYVIDNTNLNQTLYADHLALCCTGPRCYLCFNCNVHINAQADEFDDDEVVAIFEREHANINNNHVF